MIMLPSKVSKQHSIGDGGFQLGHHQANLPVQELRAVQVLVSPAKSICSDGNTLRLPHRHPRPWAWNQNNSTTFISRSTSLISSPGFPLKALIGGRLGSCVHFVLTNWSRQFARVQDRRSRFSRFCFFVCLLTAFKIGKAGFQDFGC